MNESSNTRLIVAVLVVIVLAIAFWVMALSPKREKAAELGEAVEREESALVEDRQTLETAEAAREDFSVDYRRLVALGKAVPAADEAASLIVDLHAIAKRAGIRFQEISLDSGGGEPAEAPVAATGEPEPPTEVSASLLPLGAKLGSTGLGVMPYSLVFTGRYHQVERFISGLDSLVDSRGAKVTVDGRLVTLNGFNLAPEENTKLPHLRATFSVTTFVTPPGGVPGVEGATLGPAAETATPASAEVAP